MPSAETHHLRIQPPGPVQRGRLRVTGTSDPAESIEVTSRYVERGGTPWFPITGEIHYSRLPRHRWNETLGLARAGGLTSVACYVFWRHHEPSPGTFQWTDNLDLRGFIEAAAAHGLDVIVRLGPWSHGEARHGGFPDWLIDWAQEHTVALRTDDPAYLERVRALYRETIAQLRGLTHAEGGPIIGAQVENELYDQPEHLTTLRRMAEELGLEVPLWTATGWGGAQVPETLLPVYSAYADGFWADAQTDWPHFAAPHYQFDETRDDLGTGADVRAALGADDDASEAAVRTSPTPFITCEMGGGMHVAYHRRPRVTGRDIAALAALKIGSGSAWQGYYMYAGGTQREVLGGDQESQATGYPNDVPQRSYDFAAPIGEHGQIREHYHLLRRQHLWLQAEGSRLATMTTTVGGGSGAPGEPRWAVRSDGYSGWLFASTYQPARVGLPPQQGVQFAVTFDDGETVTVPSRAVDIPAGTWFTWPLRYRLTDDLVLRSATCQVVTRLSRRARQAGTPGGGQTGDPGRDVVVLCATAGIPPELVLTGHVPVGGCARGVHTEHDGVEVTVVHVGGEPGAQCRIQLPGVEVILLDEATADRLYVLGEGQQRRLHFSADPVYLDPQTGEVVRLSQRKDSRVLSDLHPEATAGVPRTGGPADRLTAPDDYSGAAVFCPEIPPEAFGGAHRLLLRVEASFDVGRAWVGDRLISDHFWHGRVWDIDLTDVQQQVAEHGLRLELLPWDPDLGVWVDPAVRDTPAGVHLRAADLIRVERTVGV